MKNLSFKFEFIFIINFISVATLSVTLTLSSLPQSSTLFNLLIIIRFAEVTILWSNSVRMSVINKKGNVLKRNIKALSCRHFCIGKDISITYSERVFVALGNQHVIGICHIVVCLPRSKISFHIISQMARFFFFNL